MAIPIRPTAQSAGNGKKGAGRPKAMIDLAEVEKLGALHATDSRDRGLVWSRARHDHTPEGGEQEIS
jgi:hypothetical protein